MNEENIPVNDAFALVHTFLTRSIQGELTDAEISDFELLLRDNAKVRQCYIRYIEMTRLMPRLFASQEAGATHAGPPQQTPPVSDSPRSSVPGFLGDIGRQGWGYLSDHALLFSLAAVVLAAGVAGLVAVVRQTQRAAIDRTAPAPYANRPAIAWLTNAHDCCWTDKPGFSGSLRAGQKCSLDSGLAEVHFQSGVRVVLEGPLVLELVSENSIRLVRGKLTAHVPPEARGFQILSTQGKVVDLGTEFGMAVADDGSVEVHVFDGRVEAYPAATPDKKLDLRQGQAVQISAAQVSSLSTKPSGQSDFVRAIVPSPSVAPRTLEFDFRHPAAGTIRDRAGNGTGLTYRLPGTGSALAAQDNNLFLNCKSGQLELTTTETDLNSQFRLDCGEYLGVRLADLGFTGAEDFEISMKVGGVPFIAGLSQIGLYVGNGADWNIRGGLIGGDPTHAAQFLVNNRRGWDHDLNYVGLVAFGSDLTLTLRRKDGRYVLVSDNLTEQTAVALSTKHPEFLDGAGTCMGGSSVPARGPRRRQPWSSNR